jgi:hypothetical protein
MDQDADYPCAVEIPIPRAGLGPLLPVLLDAAKACQGGARLETFAAPPHAEVRAWFHAIATVCREEADRLASIFRSIGARRVR